MKNFIQRAITGLIFVAVLVGCIIGSPLSFGLLFCIISAMATAEFCHLMNQQEGVKVNKNICILGSITLFLCFFYYVLNRFLYSFAVLVECVLLSYKVVRRPGFLLYGIGWE